MNIIKNLSNSMGKGSRKFIAGLVLLTSSQLFQACKTTDANITPNGEIKPSIDRSTKEKELNSKLSLQNNMEIPVMNIYLGYSKDKKEKFDDVFTEQVNTKIDEYMNAVGSNIINNIKIVDGFQKADGTNRKIKNYNSDLIFTDDEIKSIISNNKNILNNTKIRNYISELNNKRIDDGLFPIIQCHVIIGAEIYDAGGLTNSSSTDGFGLSTPYSSKNPIINMDLVTFPSVRVHELFRHMCQNGHQDDFIKFENSPNGEENLKYFEGMSSDISKANLSNSLYSTAKSTGGETQIMENGQQKIITRVFLGMTPDYKNYKYRLDTLNIEKRNGEKGIINTTNPNYNGDQNRQNRETKYNNMVKKYISDYITWKKGNTGARLSYNNYSEKIISCENNK